MTSKLRKIASFLLLFFVFFTPQIQAHEVYVLDKHEIASLTNSQPLNLLTTIKAFGAEFTAAALFGISLVIFIFVISTSKKLESLLDPILFRLKPLAPIITQVTLGTAMIASGHYGAFFGIELPISEILPQYPLISPITILIGFMILVGVYARIAALMVLILYLFLFSQYQFYMLNYLIYLGEAITLVLWGSNYQLIKHLPTPQIKFRFRKELKHWHHYKFMLLRISFGISLIYSAFYAKFLHGQLALATVEKFSLTSYFPFEALFIVLGAFIIENIIGLFLLLGIEVRFTSIFLFIFLVLSLLFFKESVWPHFMLLGTATAMGLHGYDKYTLEGFFFKKGKREPVL